MNKEEALNKIKELQQFVEGLDKKQEISKNNIVEDNSGKDWRDAFTEEITEANIEKVSYNNSNCIKMNNCNNVYSLASIIAYTLQFKNGGLWYDDGLYLATSNIGSDEKANYEDAKQFLKNQN